MHRLMSRPCFLACALSLAATPFAAEPLSGAQTAAQPDEPAPATVVITAPRPDGLAPYRAAAARIRYALAHRATTTSSWCAEQAFMQTGPRPDALNNWKLDARIRCGRGHIRARDNTLRQALDAFDRQDYAAARGLFGAAYTKMGSQDAALMLAKMHLDGLGAPQDRAAGIRWLLEVADGYFDPWHDLMRFNPDKPQAMNARIEAALMLARIFAQGDGAARDAGQARKWAAKAAQFGYVPALAPDKLNRVASTVPARAAGEDLQVTAPAPARSVEAARAVVPPAQALPASLIASAGDPVPVARQPDAPLQVDPAFQIVRITGLRAIPWKSYRAMRAAIDAYEANKALAPDAVFSFALLPPAGRTLPPSFKLRVRTRDGREYPIALDNGELFQLPALPGDGVDADLVSNFRDGTLRIGLLVHTRSVPPEKERLGDVRLRNEINQAIAEVDHPSETPNCLRKRAGHNGCKARPRATVWHHPRAPAMGAWIMEGGRREALASDNDPVSPSYKMPVDGTRWGNDAIIEFDYKGLLRAPKLSEVAIYDAND